MKQSVPTRRSSSLAAAKRPGSRRSGRSPATAGAFALALGLTPAVAPEAAAQSNSGIYINNDVLNSLGPGPEAAPFAPLAPAAPPTPLSPYGAPASQTPTLRSEEHTSELPSLMRISYAVFCLKKKNTNHQQR